MAIEAATPIRLNQKSQQGVVDYVKAAYASMGSHVDMREKMLEIDRIYMRERDRTNENLSAKAANAYGDADKLQNITVPVVLPVVESAVTYQTSVFLTGSTLFGVASNKDTMDAALQLETVIDNQATKGGWARELQLFFRDGFKYNLCAVEVSWDSKKVVSFETDLQFNTKNAKPVETLWEGNKVKRINPYNLILDTRYDPVDIAARGDFVGYVELMSQTELRSFFMSLPERRVENLGAALSSSFSYQDSYYIPDLNPGALNDRKKNTEFNWLAWAGVEGSKRKAYSDTYEVTTIYARIIPNDFGITVPAASTPQIWKFILVNMNVLIYAERQTNAHNLLPILIGQPLEDGLGYQTKSLAQNVTPIQDVTSAMWNSMIAARRRAISDRTLYDPSRIDAAHINSPNPSAKIPVRPSAYGSDLSKAVYPFPFRDDQSGALMQESAQVFAMADKISGQNPARQGQFVKGNKTRQEFDTVMGNANGRDQSVSILLEAQIFTPMKEILKHNILQYQGAEILFNKEARQQVTIDPIALRKAVLEFKVSDGLTPVDKLMDTETYTIAMQTLGASPQIAQGYELAPLFSYIMKLRGARINDFEKPQEQLQYEQQVAAWQQAVAQIIKANPAATADNFPPQPAPPGAQPQGQPQGQPQQAM